MTTPSARASLFARSDRADRIRATIAEPDRLAAVLDETPVPAAITDWLGRLHTLLGVPFGYLVPSEDMLPPESIRFFRLDESWVEALLDGAFSLGRDLTLDETSKPAMLASAADRGAVGRARAIDRAVVGPVIALARASAPVHRLPAAHRQARLRTAGVRPVLRLTASLTSDDQPGSWTGFLLRSTLVGAYPGLGVTVYPQGHTPDDPDPDPLLVRRLDRLGPDTDTVFCLVEGEAYQIDVHEAPELLHYGLTTYTAPAGGSPTAHKSVHAFDRAADGTITFRTSNGQPVILDVNLTSSLRPGSPRVIDLAGAASAIGAADNPSSPAPIDSAQLGFAMTAGVGMVSFVRRPTPPRAPSPPSRPTESTVGEGTGR